MIKIDVQLNLIVDGAVCQTVDAAFHPDTFKMMYNPAFQAMVINITLESATKQLG